MVGASRTATQRARQVVSDHEGFLRHRRFYWLKVAALVSLAALVGYILSDVKPRPNGGSWYGYTLGTLGAGLIVWLSLLGVRKRTMTAGGWSLKAWTSAHVYLGLALIVIATLHTGFQFGWNVHTLAYTLMLLVIASGLFGIIAYSTLPAALSRNRGEMTQAQMIEGIAAIDRQLHDAAQPLSRSYAEAVIAALGQDYFGGGLMARLSGRGRGDATDRAVALFEAAGPTPAEPAVAKVEALLRRRKAQLERLRRHLRLKALLEIWLYFHVPATIALIAALTAHIIAVFFYW